MLDSVKANGKGLKNFCWSANVEQGCENVSCVTAAHLDASTVLALSLQLWNVGKKTKTKNPQNLDTRLTKNVNWLRGIPRDHEHTVFNMLNRILQHSVYTVLQRHWLNSSRNMLFNKCWTVYRQFYVMSNVEIHHSTCWTEKSDSVQDVVDQHKFDNIKKVQ